MTTTMNRVLVCAVLAIGLAIVGCERSDDTTPTGGGTAATPAAPSTPATPTETAATPATPSTPATPAAPADPAAAQTAAKTDAPTTAPAAAGTATAAEVTQAQTLIDQTLQYVKENKMDLAEKSLTQLEGLKPKLPVEYHSKIDTARKAFNAAKTGQGLKLDSLVPGAK